MILSSFSEAGSGDSFVGNAGDLIRINGRLVLRDLALIEDPYFSGEIDEALARERFFNSRVFAEIQNRLNQKLVDTNLVSPGLGDALRVVIRLYSWNLAEDWEGTEQGNVIKIADRSGSTISLSRSRWNALSSDEKVALIIHEAISAIVLPRDINNGKEAIQSQRLIIEIVAALFRKETFFGYWDGVRHAIRDNLAIPDDLNLTRTRQRAKLSAVILGNKAVRRVFERPKDGGIRAFRAAAASFSREICGTAAGRNGNSADPAEIKVSLETNHLRIEWLTYEKAGMDSDLQKYLKISVEPIPLPDAISVGKNDSAYCLSSFDRYFDYFLNSDTWLLP